MRITVPCPLPSKTNQYEIHFHGSLWACIYHTVSELKKHVRGPLYWIAPSKETKDVEKAIGYAANLSIAEDTDQPVMVEAWVSDRLDADNALKIILDGIQLSGRIKNDRQVKELAVHKIPMKNTEFSFEVTVLNNYPWGSLPGPEEKQ